MLSSSNLATLNGKQNAYNMWFVLNLIIISVIIIVINMKNKRGKIFTFSDILSTEYLM